MLAALPAESVQCCVTSPPYWGLRDYGTATWNGGDKECDHSPERRGGRFARAVSAKQRSNTGSGTISGRECPCGARRVDAQLGLESTPEEYVANMVAVFREVRRVLRDDGTLWLNLGDSYAGVVPPGLKPKDLVGIPWRLAFALQADGWWLRSDIIWAKPNPMPESVTDRPTKAHEYVFLLSKRATYYYDAAAIRTLAKSDTTKMPDGWDTGPGAHGTIHRNGREKGRRTDKQRGHSRRHDGFNDRWDHMEKSKQTVNGANARTVWQIATQPYSGAHFATFPEELARRCIVAGSPRARCPSCGAALHGARLDHAKLSSTAVPVVSEEVGRAPQEVLQSLLPREMAGEASPHNDGENHDAERLRPALPAGSSARESRRIRDGASRGDGTGNRTSVETDRGCAPPQREARRQSGGESGVVGEICPRPTAETADGSTCDPVPALRGASLPDWTCDACGCEGQWGDAKPSVILDPFGGSGTVAQVATGHGRDSIYIELNPAYLELARQRIGPMLCDEAPCARAPDTV